MSETTCNNKTTAKVTIKFWKDLFDENHPELFVTVSNTETIDVSWLIHLSPDMQDTVLDSYMPESDETITVINSGLNIEDITLKDAVDADDISDYMTSNDVEMSPKLKIFRNLLMNIISELNIGELYG